MVQPRLAEDVEHTPARPRLWVARPEHDARNAREHDRTRAHRARLERHVQNGIQDAPASSRAGGLAQHDRLGVRGGVLAQLAFVMRGRDDLPITHQYRANRHIFVFQRTLGLAQGQAHEVVVAWEEALAHRSRPRSLRQCLPPRVRPGHIIITQTFMLSRTGRPTYRPSARRTATLLASILAAAACGLCAPTSEASAAAPYAPNEILVRYAPVTVHAVAARVEGTVTPTPTEANTKLLRLPAGESVTSALRRVRGEHGVQWAVPDYTAHAAGTWVPDDEGEIHEPAGWEQLQWNFNGPFSVNAPEAWANLIADGHAGGQGVTIAVLDTGVAYSNRGPFRRSPDLNPYSFVKGYDFIGKDPYANDRNGHGTFVASTIAEATDNSEGLTGLAYGARIMPVRVLDGAGEGEASTIAEGVMFAVKHHAQVINLSLEFSPGVTAADIPELMEALRYAHRHNVLVVAAAGNEGDRSVDYPARAPDVVAVGATTEHGCLADYSNYGPELTLVAPGGGADASLPGDPNCRPQEAAGRDVFQVTFVGSSYTRFGIPSGYEGTSMATPHVAATAALIIASGVLGAHPTTAQITARLIETATKLGGGGDEPLYGAGLVNAAAATAPGGPGAPVG